MPYRKYRRRRFASRRPRARRRYRRYNRRRFRRTRTVPYRPEKKSDTDSGTVNCDWDAETNYSITNISQGDGAAARIGQRIVLKGVLENFRIDLPSDDASCIVRVIFGTWTGDNVLPTPAEILDTVGDNTIVLRPYKQTESGNFKIMYDKSFKLVAGLVETIKVRKYFNYHNKFCQYGSFTYPMNFVPFCMTMSDVDPLNALPTFTTCRRTYWYDS